LGGIGADNAVIAGTQALDELIGEETGVGRGADRQWVAGIRRTCGVTGDGADEVEEDHGHHERPHDGLAAGEQVAGVHAGDVEGISQHKVLKRQTRAAGAA
jgi:hypothetical protein